MSEEMLKPQYRFSLKSKIIEAGYRSVGDFARQHGIDDCRLSRIINGWELPSKRLHRSIAKGLGITLREFKELL